ncbi:site-specific DNA-methyltransferase [Acinetobacter indicus]|uniref:site-specific DNA-methyltransferase n=1 Tax=Acinetobacter indicus TaxID=756892 RepID=UPI0013B0935F|nr:site-specific DNA-methyltransferase [Acinetobacter indicus]QIC78705.1 site-specific DNA-methyltransferase [Acinetobacter indicus]
MDQLKMRSPNLVDSNIEKIAALFPNCITETKDENGELKKAIDFDLLKQELSQVLVEGEQERYRLDWVGKKEAILTANAPIAKTLRPCREESVNFDKTENLFIEGDNLEALKLLQENYLGKVKMIYIDPPYNTGNDFIYEDDFAESTEAFFEKSNQVDEEGNRLIANTESNGRFHSDWLSMIYSRLKLARNLLSDDGAIFISIDDGEQANLKKICDEVFGSNNFVADAIWRSKDNSNNDAKKFSIDHNHTLIYSKQSSWQPQKLHDDSKRTHFKNPDNDPKGPYFDGNPLNSPNYRENLIYDLVAPNGNIITPPKNGWRWSKALMQQKIASGEIRFNEMQTNIKRRTYLADMEGLPPSTLLIDLEQTGHNRQAKYELLKLFPEDIFQTPKPTKLIKYILKLSNLDNGDIFLDFFSGTSTSADALMQLNAEDGGKRKFIMVQLPEASDEKSDAYKAGYKNIAEISKERIRRAGKKIIEDNASKEGIENLDIGFRVLKIDSTNMKDVYYAPDALKQSDLLDMASNIKEDRTPEDLLFQVMLDWGLELSLPIERKTIAGKEVFYVAGNSLVACFDDLTFDVVDEVAKVLPLRFVSAEKAIHLDHDKTNIKERFKQLSPDTEVKFL